MLSQTVEFFLGAVIRAFRGALCINQTEMAQMKEYAAVPPREKEMLTVLQQHINTPHCHDSKETK